MALRIKTWTNWPPRPPGEDDRLLEMTPDGQFADPPRAPLLTRLIRVAVVVALLAGAIAVAALALWLALILIPIALVAALIAYGGWRLQLWRGRGTGVKG